MIRDAQAFGFFAQKIKQERAEAVAVVATIVADPERYLDEPLPSQWRTIGMAAELSEAARAQLVHSPQRSLYLAVLAAVIADTVAESYPRVLRAQTAAEAWKAVSNAHRFASRHDASLAALNVADARIADEPALAYDRAILALARAITLREMNRLEEALALLALANATFHDDQDARQIAQCELVTGMIYMNTAQYADARRAFMRVIPAARAAGDLHTVGAAYNNLGRAAAESGEVGAAVDALQQARAIFRELDMPTEIVRATWSIGAAELVAAHYESAITILSSARRDLLAIGMPEEAGLAGVDLIEALLATGARAEARELAAAVADEFSAAGLNVRALQALSYLRETAGSGVVRGGT